MTRRGFTFVEVLATTALVGLLMLVGLRVIASLGRTRAEMARREAGPADASRAIEMIRRDLANARYVKADENRLSLAGYCGLETADFAPNHRPAAVVYSLQSAGGKRWLIREQTDLDEPGRPGPWKELVFPDVGGFTLLRDDGDNGPVARPRPGAPTRADERSGAAQGGALQDTSSSHADRPWQGPAAGLVQPRGHMAVPRRVRLIVRPATPAGPRVNEILQVW